MRRTWSKAIHRFNAFPLRDGVPRGRILRAAVDAAG
jgi:hypothetical protein